MTSPPPSPACSLEAHAFQERVKWIAALNQQFLRSFSRQGRTLTLIYDAAALQQVEEMVTRERDCCAFLEFDLQRGETVKLTIIVPAQAADDSDKLLAPFYQQVTADAVSCCGTCETPARPMRAGGAAGVAVTTSTTAVVACGACCVIPLAFPAVTATVAGGALAWLGKAHVWMTGLAVLVVVIAWLWIWRQRVKRGTRASNATISLMSVASLVALLAVAWPQIEPSLMAALGQSE